MEAVSRIIDKRRDNVEWIRRFMQYEEEDIRKFRGVDAEEIRTLQS